MDFIAIVVPHWCLNRHLTNVHEVVALLRRHAGQAQRVSEQAPLIEPFVQDATLEQAKLSTMRIVIVRQPCYSECAAAVERIVRSVLGME